MIRLIQCLITGFILVISSQSFGQANILEKKIIWTATGFTDLNTNVVVNRSCQFVTDNATSKVDWIQANGSVVYSLVIKSIDGTWSDVNTNGAITFNVENVDLKGKITITKSEQGLKILLQVNADEDLIKNEYSVSGFEIL
jgi:hypothetical protein